MADMTTSDTAPRTDTVPPSTGFAPGERSYKEYELAGYSEVVRATLSPEAWSAVFFAWLSLKGHLQVLHQFDRTDCFVTIDEHDRVEALFAVTWQGRDTMGAWLETGYTVEKMLLAMGVPREDMRVQLMRDYS